MGVFIGDRDFEAIFCELSHGSAIVLEVLMQSAVFLREGIPEEKRIIGIDGAGNTRLAQSLNWMIWVT